MFSCCRCTNPDGKKSKKEKLEEKSEISEKKEDKHENPLKEEKIEQQPKEAPPRPTSPKPQPPPLRPHHTPPTIKLTLQSDEEEEETTEEEEVVGEDEKTQQNGGHVIEEQQNQQQQQEQSPELQRTPFDNKMERNTITNELPEIQQDKQLLQDEDIQTKSDSSNSTVEESILVNKSKELDNSSDSSINNKSVPNDNKTQNSQSNNNCLTKDEVKSNDVTSNGDLPKSCISRRSSSKSSIRKKVNINDSTEVIPSSELASIDDDEVFSDSVPPKIPRGDMCAPYIAKRGSIPGCFVLPEWFDNDDRFYYTSEHGGVMEPPVTPVGRDELALKRHRLYSELLMAAQAAVEHRVRFDPLGPDIANGTAAEDCDPDLKPSATAELENLINRLEKLVERLERSVSARELEIANRTFDSVVETRRRSFDLESAELPPLPDSASKLAPSNNNSENLNQRIERIEFCLNHINGNFKKDSAEGSLEDIPTVLDEYLSESQPTALENMSVLGYQDIVNGPLAQYINLSNKIGGDVAKHALFVKQAFDAQLQYVTLATQLSQPPQPKQIELLKPTSDQIAVIQDYREKNRASPFFNHLSAISESIPALGWVCVAPTPGPHVKEMNDAGQFYTNRVLKDWKEKDATHVEWARAWVQTLTELQKYIKQYHTTGLVWSGKGGVPPPPPPSAAGCPPPPPPPVMALGDLSLGANDDRSALFAEINQGENITKNLKKVTADMQTHKNATLRTGPAPFKAPQPFTTGANPLVPQAAANREPVFLLDGKKWSIEYQKSNQGLLVENAEMNNVIYMFRCQDSTLTVKGKVNSVVMDSCKKCSILFDAVVSSVEFVNCQSVQMQVLGKVPTISIDKTDGCLMYLSKDSMDVEIISSKSSEMNVVIPRDNGDYTEQPIPEQFKTTIKGNKLQTICVESLG